MDQLSISFDPPRARRSDPETSRIAAERANEFAAAHYQKILTALSEIGKGSIYDVADRAGMSHVQVARRTAEMDGKRIRTIPGEKRRSPSGRPCRVWTAI